MDEMEADAKLPLFCREVREMLPTELKRVIRVLAFSNSVPK